MTNGTIYNAAYDESLSTSPNSVGPGSQPSRAASSSETPAKSLLNNVIEPIKFQNMPTKYPAYVVSQKEKGKRTQIDRRGGAEQTRWLPVWLSFDGTRIFLFTSRG